MSGAGFDAGSYDLSESAVAGYSASSWSCTGGQTGTEAKVTVALGGDITCTITNNDNAPKLTLNKVVVNDNGGTAVAADWTLTALGNPATDPASLSGPGAPGNADVVSGAGFDAGSYDLSESRSGRLLGEQLELRGWSDRHRGEGDRRLWVATSPARSPTTTSLRSCICARSS